MKTSAITIKDNGDVTINKALVVHPHECGVYIPLNDRSHEFTNMCFINVLPKWYQFSAWVSLYKTLKEYTKQ